MVQDIDINNKIESDEIIWRYMDFASFYWLLQSKSLFFRRIDKYTDQYEGTLPKEVQNYLCNTWSDLFGIDESTEMVSKFCSHLKELNKGTLCNSWVLTPREIYAMWKIYLRGSLEGIAIRTTVGKLRDALSVSSENFTLAKVNYEILPWRKTSYKTLAAYKSSPYSYECELRVLVYDKFNLGTVPTDVFPKVPIYEHGTTFPVDTEKLIDYVYISPFTGEWFYDVVKSTVARFLPDVGIIFSGIKDQ